MILTIPHLFITRDCSHVYRCDPASDNSLISSPNGERSLCRGHSFMMSTRREEGVNKLPSLRSISCALPHKRSHVNKIAFDVPNLRQVRVHIRIRDDPWAESP